METIGYAALQVIPSMKGAKSTIENELNGTTGAAGKKAGSRFGGGFLSTTGKYVKRAGLIAGGLLTAKGIKGGIDRALNIEEAQSRLRGLKLDASQVESVMNSATKSVTGTAYGLDAAASAAAGAMGAGVKQGRDLTKYLTLVGDATTQSTTDFNSMALMMNKVQGMGKLTGGVMQQMALNGLQVMPMLTKAYGKNTAEMTKMVSEGKVSAADFRRVLEQEIGGAALESGSTVRGAAANMGAAFSRLGARVATAALPGVQKAFVGIGKAADRLGPVVERGVGGIGRIITRNVVPAVKAAAAWFMQYLWPALKQGAGIIGSSLGPALAKIGAAFGGASSDGNGLAKVIGKTLATAIPIVAKAIAATITVVASVIAWFIRWRDLFIAVGAGVAVIVVPLKAFALAVAVVTKALAAVRFVILAVKVNMALLNVVIMANPIGILIGALVALGVAFVVLWKRNETFRNGVTAVWNAIRKVVVGAVSAVVGFVKNNWQKLLVLITGPIGAAVLLVVKHWDRIKSATKTAWNAVRGALVGAWKAIRSAVSAGINAARSVVVGGWNAVRSATTGAWNAIRSAITGAIDKVVGVAKGMKGKITGAFSGAKTWLKEAGKNIVRGLGAGLDSMWDWVKGKINKLTDKIPGWVKKRLGIKSPSTVMAKLARWIPAGMAKGITAGSSAVEKAMKRVTSRIDKAAKRATNDQNKKAIKRAVTAAKALVKAEQKATKGIWRNRGAQRGTDFILRNSRQGGKINKRLKRQNITLADVAKARDVIANRLKKARDKLADAIAVRNDFKANVVDAVKSYTSLLHAEGQVNIYGFQQQVTSTDIAATLRERLAVVKKFTADMSTLLKAGLNKSTYQELIEAGPEAAADYAAALVAGGSSAVSEVNSLTSQINSAANALGGQSSGALYQAGVDAARGLVQGIKSQMKQVNNIAKRLANSVAKAIKKALKIKSPSQVIAALGKFIPAGLAVGMSATSQVREVANAASNMAAAAVSGVKSQLARATQAASAVSNALTVDTSPAAPSLPFVPPPWGPGDGPEAGGGYAGPRVVVEQTINNPQAEPTSKTVDAAARTLGMVGAL